MTEHGDKRVQHDIRCDAYSHDKQYYCNRFETDHLGGCMFGDPHGVCCFRLSLREPRYCVYDARLVYVTCASKQFFESSSVIAYNDIITGISEE